MGVVAVDSSGTFEEPPIWIVAVRKVQVQKHKAFCLSEVDCLRYREGHEKNWRERVSAALIFTSLDNLVKETDIIQIDKDFLGWRERYIERNLKRLFGLKYSGKSLLSNPIIQFIPAKFCPPVKEAHNKTQWARHKNKNMQVKECPNLADIIELLE